MSGVQLSEHFGIVIRKEALQRCDLDRARLLALMETDTPFDEDEELLSFDPHFGGEACQTLLTRLESAGLQYGRDVIDFSDTLPDRLQESVRLRGTATYLYRCRRRMLSPSGVFLRH